MKIPAAVVLLCLMAAAIAPAGAISAGSAGTLKIIPATTTVPPQVTKIPSVMIPVTIASQGHGMIEVYSDPSGADVALAGPSSLTGTTPAKFSVSPGTYTVTVSKAGYKSHVETFPLTTGAIKQVDADLIRNINIAAADAFQKLPTSSVSEIAKPPFNISDGVTLIPAPGSVELHLDSVPTGATVSWSNGTVIGTTPLVRWVRPGSFTQIFSHAGYDTQSVAFTLAEGSQPYYYTATLVPASTPPAPVACPDGSWSCLTLPEAARQFASSYTMNSSTPCGYLVQGGQTCYNMTHCARYCVKAPGADPSAGSAGQGITAGTGSAGTGSAAVTGNVAPQSPLQPVFDFFESLFGTKNPAEERLQRVGLNPQPEPPAQDPQVALVK